MLASGDALFLLLLLVVLAVFVGFSRARASRHREESLKYQLYKVRDDFTFLHATGKLSEDDPVYKYFWAATNAALARVDHINLKTFVSIIESIRREGIDPADKKNLELIKKSLQGKSQEVHAAADGFYRAFMQILIANSWQLPVIIWLIDFARPIATPILAYGDKIKARTAHRSAFKLYSDYGAALTATHT